MIHGVLLVNKTAGMTSHAVVSALRRVFRQKAVGHAGTLDPMAEGLLLILLGQGTKLSNYLLMNDKKYRFVFRLGAVTDTLDKTGKITEKKEVHLSVDQIESALEESRGQLSLSVPLVSAVKVKGKKLYEYKRENKPVAPPVRDMYFYDLEIKNIQSETVEVELSCNKGSYIRSWVSFVGTKLGTGAYLEALTRLRSSPFNLDSALTVQEVEERLKKVDRNVRLPSGLAHPVERGSNGEKKEEDQEGKDLSMKEFCEVLNPAFVPFSKALPHIKAVRSEKQDEKQLGYGQISKNLKMTLQEVQKGVNKNRKTQTIRIMSYNDKRMLALLELKPFLSPWFIRVFPTDLS